MRRSPKLFVKQFPRVRLEMSEGLTEGHERPPAARRTRSRHRDDAAAQRSPRLRSAGGRAGVLIGPPRDPLLKRGRLTRKEFDALPSAIVPLSRSPFPSTVPSSLRVDNSMPMKRMVAAGLGYGLLPFSGIHEEVAAGELSAALLPWMRADRVLALPRGRPVSRATREAVAVLKKVCRALINEGKILTAKT